MASNPMNLRDFIKHLDEYIKQLDAESPTKPIDTIDLDALAVLANYAEQHDAEDVLFELSEDYDNSRVDKAEVIKQLKELGSQYDI